MYGIVLFKALDKLEKNLQPDSVISFSVNYYQNTNDQLHLAQSYYYKARLLKNTQQFEKATEFYLKLLEVIQTKDNFEFAAKTYSDLGDICMMQADHKNALSKFKISYNYFLKLNNNTEINTELLKIGKAYRLMKKAKLARAYFDKLLLTPIDSIFKGDIYQELGVGFYYSSQFDSAKYYLNKSLLYPFKGTNYAIRNYVLADLYFDLNKFDSSTIFALNSLNYPANFYTRRGCYRILVNSRYSLKDNSGMKYYLSKYQDYNDSVRKLESQTKVSVLEDLHQNTKNTNQFQKYLILIGIFSFIILCIGFLFFFKLQSKSKTKDINLNKANETITKKTSLLRENLVRKIDESKTEKASLLKNKSIQEKEKAILEIYIQCLKLKKWNEYTELMNQTFENLIYNIETNYSDINHKEIIWICLFLLDVPLTDMALILESQIGSIYKLKQRIAQKMNLSSTKELESLLKSM